MTTIKTTIDLPAKISAITVPTYRMRTGSPPERYAHMTTPPNGMAWLTADITAHQPAVVPREQVRGEPEPEWIELKKGDIIQPGDWWITGDCETTMSAGTILHDNGTHRRRIPRPKPTPKPFTPRPARWADMIRGAVINYHGFNGNCDVVGEDDTGRYWTFRIQRTGVPMTLSKERTRECLLIQPAPAKVFVPRPATWADIRPGAVILFMDYKNKLIVKEKIEGDIFESNCGWRGGKDFVDSGDYTLLQPATDAEGQ